MKEFVIEMDINFDHHHSSILIAKVYDTDLAEELCEYLNDKFDDLGYISFGYYENFIELEDIVE